jgi:flagellar basal body rod protein FlgG
MVEELVNMISVTRLYEANIKSIKTNDQRMQYLLETAR